ncbi:hypothetical protein K466DRAFT_590447 [Polyporus arcularius HHB13444]|uniref:Uncharacterized protein n=1 Tax=Polyporus arcularius HHB13444 TaxID=1314778 RepID=A0A5C3NYU2_9APHY|nr:hypothetical protein K466DRAFT_590447 [Polyporus arcularius HHB13444]
MSSQRVRSSRFDDITRHLEKAQRLCPMSNTLFLLPRRSPCDWYQLVPASRLALRTLAPSHTIRQAKRTATSSRMDARHRTAIVETRGGPLVSGKSVVLQMTCTDGVVAVFLEAFCLQVYTALYWSIDKVTTILKDGWRMSAARRARQTVSAQEFPRFVLGTPLVRKTSVDTLLATGPFIVRTTMHDQRIEDPPSAEDSC